MRSVLADDSMTEILPWMDVIIDVQGPFTKGEGGEQYILSYHCTRLKVPKLAALRSLQEGYFSRALVHCVLKSRQIPDVIRSDRGPEMVNRITEEFLSICNVRHIFGAVLTPRRQGLCERNHQVTLANQTVLLHAVTAAHPQEWPQLLPVVEYLQAIAPQGSHGFSAHDLCCAYSIITEADSRLAPFRAPQGLPESETAS